MADVNIPGLPALSGPLQPGALLEVFQDGVNSPATAQQIADLATLSAAVWGVIGGDLENQTDLSAALDALATAIAGKLGDAPSDGDQYGRQNGAWAKIIAAAGGIQSIQAGAGIGVDATDPENPIVSATGTGAADRSAVTALSIAAGVVNIDCALGDFFTLLLSANVTSITFSNLPAAGKGASLAVRIRQDGTGSRTVALPASFKATGGSDTAVQSAANAYTLLTMTTFDQGTRWEYAMQEVAA